MSEDIKGVFVRLPNDATDPQWAKAYAAVVGDEETKKAALWDFIQIAKAISTPVTGGELEIFGYADPADSPIGSDWSYEILGKVIHGFTEPLVRQSDALAQIAARDAEITRLNEELSVYRVGMSELIAKEVATLKVGAA